MRVAIVKYNAGNIYSVVNALNRLGVEQILTDDAEIIMSADRVVFPGQGEAGTAMRYLHEHRLDEVLKNLSQPVLGICIGQQLLCRHSEEGDTPCLGIFPVDVKKFVARTNADKIPSIGWNELENMRSPLFKGFTKNEYVYFVHSYYVPVCDFTVATTNYIVPYSAALHKDNFYSTQFHPEKSGKVGERILKNFLDL